MTDEEADNEISDLVAWLYQEYLKTNSDTPKITSHDLAYWAYGQWHINIRQMHAITTAPNIPLGQEQQ